MEQRLAIRLYFKDGKCATETLQMVDAAYGDRALSCSNVFRWYGRFRDGREVSEGDPRSGRPTVS
jgi:transposase